MFSILLFMCVQCLNEIRIYYDVVPLTALVKIVFLCVSANANEDVFNGTTA